MVLGLDWLGLQLPKCASQYGVRFRWSLVHFRPGIFSVCSWDTITVTSSSSITTLKMEWSYRMWHRFRGAACHCAIVTVAPGQHGADPQAQRRRRCLRRSWTAPSPIRFPLPRKFTLRTTVPCQGRAVGIRHTYQKWHI